MPEDENVVYVLIKIKEGSHEDIEEIQFICEDIDALKKYIKHEQKPKQVDGFSIKPPKFEIRSFAVETLDSIDSFINLRKSVDVGEAELSRRAESLFSYGNEAIK